MKNKRYIGTIWIGAEKRPEAIELAATDAEDAMRQVEEKWGLGHEYTVWNPEDSAKPR